MTRDPLISLTFLLLLLPAAFGCGGGSTGEDHGASPGEPAATTSPATDGGGPAEPAATEPPAPEPTPDLSTGPTPVIDVSNHQGAIDWRALHASGIRYVWIKATEGIDYVDPDFHDNWRGAREAGIVTGAYHFFRARDEGEAQAEWFLGTVTHEPGDLLPAVDVEVPDGVDDPALMVRRLRAYMSVVSGAVGRPPVIYTSPKFWESLGTDDFGHHPLWIAEYGVSEPQVPSGWTSWSLWQHTDDDVVAGVAKPVDLSASNGPLHELEHLFVPGS